MSFWLAGFLILLFDVIYVDAWDRLRSHTIAPWLHAFNVQDITYCMLDTTDNIMYYI